MGDLHIRWEDVYTQKCIPVPEPVLVHPSLYHLKSVSIIMLINQFGSCSILSPPLVDGCEFAGRAFSPLIDVIKYGNAEQRSGRVSYEQLLKMVQQYQFLPF